MAATVPYRCQEAWATCPYGYPFCYWGTGANAGKCCMKPWSSVCKPAVARPGRPAGAGGAGGAPPAAPPGTAALVPGLSDAVIIIPASQIPNLTTMVRAISIGQGTAAGPSGARRSTVPYRCQEAWANCPRGFPYCYWGHGANAGKCCMKPWSSLCVPPTAAPGQAGPRVTAALQTHGGLAGPARGLPGATGGGMPAPAATGGAHPFADGKWRRATATWYQSYPECCDNPAADQTECVKYNGCRWKGQFAGIVGPRSRQWVMSNNLVSFFANNNAHNKATWARLWKGRKLELRHADRPAATMTVTVVDTCDDNDTHDKQTCTRNANKNGNGFLVDLEMHTARRFYGNRIQDMKTIEWRIVR